MFGEDSGERIFRDVEFEFQVEKVKREERKEKLQ